MNPVMKFYVTKENGKLCVQNLIIGFGGQYHEHTPEDFMETQNKAGMCNSLEKSAMETQK